MISCEFSFIRLIPCKYPLWMDSRATEENNKLCDQSRNIQWTVTNCTTISWCPSVTMKPQKEVSWNSALNIFFELHPLEHFPAVLHLKHKRC
jgi:hypothetical protein